MTAKPKVQLDSFDDIFNTMPTQIPAEKSNTDNSDNTSVPVELPLELLVPFHNHPFNVNMDDDMDRLIYSIANEGLVSPIIVRPLPDNKYEILAGHRRTEAYRQLGLNTIPSIIKMVSDNDANLIMYATNIYREHISISEKARSAKVISDTLKAIKRGKGQCDPNAPETALALSFEASEKTLKRLVKLNDLSPGLMAFLDNGTMAMMVGYDLCFLKADEQDMLLGMIADRKTRINGKKSGRLKELSQKHNLTADKMKTVLYGEIRQKRSIAINNKKLNEYFPAEYTKDDIERTIYSLLDEWKNNKEKQNG